MKHNKAIWYCTGCNYRCAVKILEETVPYRTPKDCCLLYTQATCETIEVHPDWHKHEPQKRETEVKAPF